MSSTNLFCKPLIPDSGLGRYINNNDNNNSRVCPCVPTGTRKFIASNYLINTSLKGQTSIEIMRIATNRHNPRLSRASKV